MRTHLFEAFAEMVDGLPDEGILKAIELERQMLKDDLLYKRVSDEEVASIFIFCEFIKTVVEEDAMIPTELPTDQIACFRKIVMRLIRAGELPFTAREQFDLTFSSSFLTALAS